MNLLVLDRKKAGLCGSALRLWGFLLMVAGAVGAAMERIVLSDGVLASGRETFLGAFSLALQALSTGWVPLLVFFTVEDGTGRGGLKKCLLLSAFLEIPYDIAVSGRIIDGSRQNPFFALFLCLFLTWSYRRYEKKRAFNALVTVAALFWAAALSIDGGIASVLLLAVFFATRKKETVRLPASAAVLSLCTALSPLYIITPLFLIPLHFYGGRE
ncbi:MAG: hypothetical protein E7647_08040 [Ruminococcaceae bacterium]|nr:hypothetical protein [Oscillospiraceae bacterium]